MRSFSEMQRNERTKKITHTHIKNSIEKRDTRNIKQKKN